MREGERWEVLETGCNDEEGKQNQKQKPCITPGFHHASFMAKSKRANKFIVEPSYKPPASRSGAFWTSIRIRERHKYHKMQAL